jgi:uncharacterized glyoxalase superfamily protein PhnB
MERRIDFDHADHYAENRAWMSDMILSRDGVSLFLTEHAGDCQVDGAAYIVVDDLDAFSREITQYGVQVDEPPQDTPWGTREMCVIDSDGHRLRLVMRRARLINAGQHTSE